MKPVVTIIFLILLLTASAQEEEFKVQTLDSLTYAWDANAKKLQTYEGLSSFCSDRFFRAEIIDLLEGIHHYDTLLLFIVTNKTGKEAEATLQDIETLEVEYKTLSFKRFIHQECNTYNEIENNFGRSKGDVYNEEVENLEDELKKYVIGVTKQIDLIDEHAHHLDLE